LIEWLTPQTEIGDGPYKLMNHVGITRMAFAVDDTDAIHAKLLERGDIEFLCEPQSVEAPTGGTLRILTFKDPLGIVLELIEYRPQAD
jgi:extradiol dioxygenase family protein